MHEDSWDFHAVINYCDCALVCVCVCVSQFHKRFHWMEDRIIREGRGSREVFGP